TNWRDPTACFARPQELTRKFAHQRLRRAICRSFLHPAALAAIRRSGRNKSGVAAPSRRGRLVCSSNKEPPSGGLFVWARRSSPSLRNIDEWEVFEKRAKHRYRSVWVLGTR